MRAVVNLSDIKAVSGARCASIEQLKGLPGNTNLSKFSDGESRPM